jgi:hypothetical protein
MFQLPQWSTSAPTEDAPFAALGSIVGEVAGARQRTNQYNLPPYGVLTGASDLVCLLREPVEAQNREQNRELGRCHLPSS